MEIDTEIGTLLDTRYRSLIEVLNDFAVSIAPQLQTRQSHEAFIHLDTELPNIVNTVDRLLEMGIADDRLACLHLISLIVHIERYFTVRGLWEANEVRPSFWTVAIRSRKTEENWEIIENGTAKKTDIQRGI
jgi:hypothetical protein